MYSTKGCLRMSIRKTHYHTVECVSELPVVKANNLMHTYVKRGNMLDARHVFDSMPKHDVVSWNIMILGYARLEEGVKALELYARMCQERVQLNDRTFVAALKACSSLSSLDGGRQITAKMCCFKKGKEIHSQVVKSGFDSDTFVGTTLVDMYAKCGNMGDARCVFDDLPHRDVASWNAMILGYAERENSVLALKLYAQMPKEGIQLNARTFVSTLKACSSITAVEAGKQVDRKDAKNSCLEKGRAIHFCVVKAGFESDMFVGTSLVDMYSKCGVMDDAWCIFDRMQYRDVVSWNAMILGYSNQEEAVLALDLYARMQQEHVCPNARSFVGALKACGILAVLEEDTEDDGKFSEKTCLEKARAIHSQAVKSGFELDGFVGNTLVDVYGKCGSMQDARRAFDECPCHDVVTWTAMILGYSKQEQGAMALDLLAQMHQEGAQPNARTFVGALKACSCLTVPEEGKEVDRNSMKIGWLEKGRAIYFQLVKSGFESDTFVGNTLVDMCAKCRNLDDARCVFDVLPDRDAVSWNAMILGYAEQEQSEEAFRLYAQMQEQGLSPNSFTFVAILKACGDTAALDIGKELHFQIRRAGLATSGVVTTSLIDMYAKCGSMVEAQQLFDALLTRDVVPWSSLIAGYARQGESELVFHLFERMMHDSIKPNGVIFLSLLIACSHVGLVDKGHKYFQAMSKQYGIIPTVEHYTCMVDLHGRAGQVDEATAVVERMPFQPDGVVWSTVLGACQKWKNIEVGRQAFDHAVRLDGKLPAAYVLMSNMYVNAHFWDGCEEIQMRRGCSSMEKL